MLSETLDRSFLKRRVSFKSRHAVPPPRVALLAEANIRKLLLQSGLTIRTIVFLNMIADPQFSLRRIGGSVWVSEVSNRHESRESLCNNRIRTQSGYLILYTDDICLNDVRQLSDTGESTCRSRARNVIGRSLGK